MIDQSGSSIDESFNQQYSQVNDSFTINQRNYLKNPSNLNLNNIIEMNRQTLDDKVQTIKIQIRQPDIVENEFRQRVFTQYLNELRDNNTRKSKLVHNQTSSAQKIKFPLFYLPTDQEVKKQELNNSIYRVNKQITHNGTNWLFCSSQHTNTSLYMILVYCYIYCEENDQLMYQKEIDTYEALIQNIQIADKYMNGYGLFYAIKQGLSDYNIQFIMTKNSQYFQQNEITKGRQILQTSIPAKSNLMSFKELVFFSSSYSLLKFQIYFKDTQTLNYLLLKNDYKLLQQLKQKIGQLLRKPYMQVQQLSKDQEPINESFIHWFRLKLIENDTFMLEFTMPNFRDFFQLNFSNECFIYIQSELPNILICQSLPLIDPIELQLENFDPFQNMEYRTDAGPIWRLHAIKHRENTNGEQFGFINLFFNDDQDRQDLSKLGLGQVDGIVIVTKYSIFAQKEGLYPFLKCKWIQGVTYKESKRFKILLRVGFNKSKTIEVKTGDQIFDQAVIMMLNLIFQVFLMTNWENITLHGILIQEEILMM